MVVRGFSISSQQLSERDSSLSTSTPVDDISSAYCVRLTGTLLIAVGEEREGSWRYHLLALSEERDEWLQRDSLEVAREIKDICALEGNRIIC